ncbi:hypothetical protein ACOI1H_16870 [Loktanella sp. DJP18]|uniref:hypothetical protein n=1 Tax=Loktanella sp. DJP18 TaxID=3409788 RepID=UPI003BB5B9E2
MPGPDPQAIWIEDGPNGGFSISFEKYFWTGKTGHRAARADFSSDALIRAPPSRSRFATAMMATARAVPE